jgi:hypothetical protein
MLLELLPPKRYAGELWLLASESLYGNHRLHSFLDLLAAIMRLPRAIFYTIFVNVAFFHVVYKVGEWSLWAGRWLFRIIRYLLVDAVDDSVRFVFYLADVIWRFILRKLRDWLQ